MTNSKRLRGFTMIEMLVVVVILSVLTSAVLPSLLNFRRSSLLNTETQEVITLINRARLLSVSSKNDERFGVHFEPSRLVLFQGSTYTEGATTNEEHNFDLAISSETTINGGGAEILFAKVTGAASQLATTTLLFTGTTASSTVIIRKSGVVTIY